MRLLRPRPRPDPASGTDWRRPQDLTPVPNARLAAMWRRYVHFWGPRADADVDEELEFHTAMRMEDHVARGMPDAEARAAVASRLGDLGRIRTECIAIHTRRNRRMARAQMLDAFVQDIRFGLRAMLRQKGWTAVAVITLALGIGANTAVFSVVNNLVLHPIDYPNADRLAVVFEQPRQNSVSGVSVYVTPTTPVLRAWRSGTHAFQDLEGFSPVSRILRTGSGVVQSVNAVRVEPGLAAFTGKRPLRGRYFTSQDVKSRAHVAVLSEGFWRSRFGGADSAIGRTISLDRDSYTIVGVMPAAFQLPSLLQTSTDVFLPLDVNDDQIGVTMIGRLRPGATPDAAARELDTISAHQPGASQPLDFVASVVPPGRILRFRDSLVLFAAAAALVLIIACANVAHLLLARGAAREREMAVRAAVGAGRGRLVRQLLAESLLLAGVGCVAGIGVGWVGLRGVVALRPQSLSQLSSVHLDGLTLLVALGLAVATGVVVALVGAWQAARLASPEALRVGAPTSVGAGHTRLRSALVVTEMALSTTLLVGAALLIKSFAHLQFADPGFQPQGLYALSPDLSATSDSTNALRWAFADRLAERVRAMPGVRGVTVATTSPPGRNFSIGALQVEGQPVPAGGATSFVNTLGVRPDFFSLAGMHFVAGGTFTDTTAAAAQVIINDGMARKFWPQESAVGHRLRLTNHGQGHWLTIVGVVNDAATGGMLMQRTDPMLYVPPASFFSPTVIARLDNPAATLPAIRAVVHDMNAAIPPVDISNVANDMAKSLAARRFTMLMLVVFTGIAVLLASVGLYGVMAYSVAQRSREIGIRIALGATTGRVARGVVARGAALGVVGVLLGLVAASWGTTLLSNMLSGVTQRDPMSFGAAAAVLLLTALVACVAPTMRAARVDPMVAMRADV